MSDGSKIEWTEATWNPVTGCTEVSPGCDHCYAKTFAERWRGIPGHHFERGFDVVLRPERLDQPMRWRRPRRIFVNSMSDLFHDRVPARYIADVFAVMTIADRHIFQVLTKRHGRMRSLLTSVGFWRDVSSARNVRGYDSMPYTGAGGFEPPANVWLGVSVENQQWADIRIPALLDTPAAVRWISAEPLLGPVDLCDCAGIDALERDWVGSAAGGTGAPHPLLDWVVVGGESGPGARPMELAWARSLRDQCVAAGVPLFFKQWGNWVPPSQMTEDTFRDWDFHHGTGMWDMDQSWRVGKKRAGRLLDGREWNEMPA